MALFSVDLRVSVVNFFGVQFNSPARIACAARIMAR